MYTKIIRYMFILLIVYCLFSIIKSKQPEQMSEEVMNRMFANHQFILIYVKADQNQAFQIGFQQFCHKQVNCVIMDIHNQFYQNVRYFIGYEQLNYLLVIDTQTQKKYVQKIDKQTGIQAIQYFYINYRQFIFYASQAQPLKQNFFCKRLVGSTITNFLLTPNPIKVIYLTTNSQICEICQQILQIFKHISQKLHRQDVISFGYVDIFKNDHQIITEEITPYFLVFKQGEDQPFGIQGEKIEELQNALINIIAEHLYPDYNKQKLSNTQHQDTTQHKHTTQHKDTTYQFIQTQDFMFIDGQSQQQSQQQSVNKFIQL